MNEATGEYTPKGDRTTPEPTKGGSGDNKDQMKAIKAAGGKWNRSAQKHLFDGDPREVLGLALEAGEVVDRLRSLDQFFTPSALAIQLVDKLMEQVDEGPILEPSAGEGAIARVLLSHGYHVVCVEIDDALIPVLGAMFHAVGWPKGGDNETDRRELIHGDFLDGKVAEDLAYRCGAFSGVVMNPPFSGDDGMRHVLAAFSHLQPGGRLVAVLPPSWVYKTTRYAESFRNWVQGRATVFDAEEGRVVRHEWVELPANSFRASGTDVRCGMLTLEKAE